VANKKVPNRALSGAQLAKVTAEKIFAGRMSISTPASLSARRRDRAERWRKARVPDYNNDQRQAYAIDERMKQLGRWERYNDDLSESPR
jgi:hypothetical protein